MKDPKMSIIASYKYSVACFTCNGIVKSTVEILET